MSEETECNVDDVLCQMMALSHLKGLKSVLGEEKYRAEFPELQSLDEKIASRETILRETLNRCTPILAGSELVEGVKPNPVEEAE